ncbi:MAG: adenosylcobinamide-GDP ribazoletransferase [Chloroflexi bacterium]|nr:adenosylcobinamide-GDP ribazoletransferase [Chloroflexota bacterium]
MSLLTALRFLTALPLPDKPYSTPADLGRSLAWFPLVGALLGLALAVANWAGLALVGDPAAAALTLTVSAILTGALHLDGFADSCDGLFARVGTVERRLEIMRDSRVGGFGAAGVAMLLLVKYSALLSVPADDRFRGLVLAGLLSRSVMVQAIGLFPYAREQGLGRAFKDNAGSAAWGLAATTALAGAALLFGVKGLVIAAMAAMLCWLVSRYVMTKLPGMTGDTYGALCEMTEVAVLLALAGGR